MVNIIIELSKYIIIIMITMYTFMCFSIFGFRIRIERKECFEIRIF